MVIEGCRNQLGWADANSTEMNENTQHPVVIYMPEVSKTHMGGTMRCGARVTRFVQPNSKSGTTSIKLYVSSLTRIESLYAAFGAVHNGGILERHRHRYEVNPENVETIEKSTGLAFVGKDETGQRMEIVERPSHPYFVGVQYHPEFLSRPLNPSPLFVGLLQASSQ